MIKPGLHPQQMYDDWKSLQTEIITNLNKKLPDLLHWLTESILGTSLVTDFKGHWNRGGHIATPDRCNLNSLIKCIGNFQDPTKHDPGVHCITEEV